MSLFSAFKLTFLTYIVLQLENSVTISSTNCTAQNRFPIHRRNGEKNTTGLQVTFLRRSEIIDNVPLSTTLEGVICLSRLRGETLLPGFSILPTMWVS